MLENFQETTFIAASLTLLIRAGQARLRLLSVALLLPCCTPTTPVSVPHSAPCTRRPTTCTQPAVTYQMASGISRKLPGSARAGSGVPGPGGLREGTGCSVLTCLAVSCLGTPHVASTHGTCSKQPTSQIIPDFHPEASGRRTDK
jgi:hypothetical protein